MVHLKRLVIALFLVLITSNLLSETRPPYLLSKPEIEIPDTWSQKYDPMEVLVEVSVLPDSTAILEEIKDDKIELFDLIDKQIRSMKWSPMFEDDIAIEMKLLQKFQLIIIQAEAEQIAEFEIIKEYIDTWITKEKAAFNTFAPLITDIFSSPYLSSVDLYRIGYHYTMRYNPTISIHRDGFGKPSSILSTLSYVGNYDVFAEPDARWNELHFNSEKYTQAVPLADIQASIGDYEFKYARGTFHKNHLFNIKDVYLAFAFLVQDGDYMQVKAPQTSYTQSLQIPLGRFLLIQQYESYEQDVAMYQLNPVYWQSAGFTMDQRLSHFSLKLQNPWLDVAWRQSSEKTSSTVFAKKLSTKTQQFLIQRNFSYVSENTKTNLETGFEKYLYERNYSPSILSYDDRFFADASYEYKDSKLCLKADLYDFERLDIKTDLSQKIYNQRIGLFAFREFNNTDKSTVSTSLYSATDTLHAITIVTPENYALYLQTDPQRALAFKISSGIKRMLNYYPYLSDGAWQDITYDKSIPYADMSLVLKQELGRFDLDFRQDAAWNSFDEDLRELPQFTYSTYLQIKKKLKLNNALFAGLGVYGHSSYVVLNANNSIIENSMIMDFWTGFQITNMFEMVFSFKNVLDGTIYGIYPAPQSLHASIRWFYLN